MFPFLILKCNTRLSQVFLSIDYQVDIGMYLTNATTLHCSMKVGVRVWGLDKLLVPLAVMAYWTVN
jgi:hypothetical protein